jgi:DnaJ-class molecular chaperone
MPPDLFKKRGYVFSNDIENDITLEIALSVSEFLEGTQKRIVLEEGAIEVRIPSNFSPGKCLRIRGKGKLNPYTRQRGDLYLKVVERPKDDLKVVERPQEGIVGKLVDELTSPEAIDDILKVLDDWKREF